MIGWLMTGSDSNDKRECRRVDKPALTRIGQNATRCPNSCPTAVGTGKIPDIFANSIDLPDIFAILRVAKPVSRDGWRGSHNGY